MDQDPDPTSDSTPFFYDFKDAKKLFVLFLITYPHGLNNVIFCQNFVLKFYFASIISVR
jgi:hypothetical protein